VFDEQAALTYTGGDRRLLGTVIGLFQGDAPSYLRRIGRAVQRRDGDGLRLAAHALKGALATAGSRRGREIAAELERMGREADFADAEASCLELREHLRLLDQAFAAAGFGRRSSPAARSATSRSPRRK
jgi:HPt (histidine-containing phosphotransfer) domain-containing protein